MKKSRVLLTALAVACLSTPVWAEEVAPMPDLHKHWSYQGNGSAHKWGDLDPLNGVCKSGALQSPVNIVTYMQEDLPALEPAYQDTPLHVVNNGHTVQVNYAPGSQLTIAGKAYQLLQLHFHTPSEHYFDGAPYPMEVHFVHKAADGTLGVVGAMMKVGAHNPVIEGIWANTPTSKGEKEVDMVKLNAADLLPSTLDYYAYEGSLTTPPCTEGVQWHVLKKPIELSQAQLAAFQGLFPMNARPVQGLGDRVIRGD